MFGIADALVLGFFRALFGGYALAPTLFIAIIFLIAVVTLDLSDWFSTSSAIFLRLSFLCNHLFF
ncbi:MAG: hypothetical protein AMJ78_00065 [Omnitrophica WOR_2 bacterium SM23_29]|nr:MAG: hypothetical protein AMJ78_00065 [Omnitrophica WOR_2 bacterium SM23_29]